MRKMTEAAAVVLPTAAALLLAAFCTVAAGQIPPFHVQSYGDFRKIISNKKLDGVIELEHTLSSAHSYAVGEIRNAEGEITVYDGRVWLNYGDDGIDKSVREIPQGEQAMQLITAEVAEWKEITVPRNMSDEELYRFVLEQARKMGLDIKLPFPFLVKGNFKDLVWHVLQDADVGSDKQLFFTKLLEYREAASAVVVGFCSEGSGGFISPGELWHAHVIFPGDRTSGHVDAFSVKKGAKLSLPVK